MRPLALSLSALLVICGAARAAPAATPAMGFEIEGAWLSAAPELFTQFEPEQIWAFLTMPLPELAAGVELSGDHVKQGAFAGRWANHPRFPTIHTQDIPHDWSSVQSLSFWARSEVATGELITLALLSDSPQTPWRDYYWYTFGVDWSGWKQLRLALSDFEAYEQPAGWQQVDAIYFFTKIFDRQPNPYTVLCLDDVQLGDATVTSDPPAWQPPPLPPGTIPVRGFAPAFDPTSVNHPYSEVRDPVSTPFQTLAYFQGVRACQGYYPRYHPGFVSFDPQGKPHLQYGPGIVQTLGPDGKWQVHNLLMEVVEPYAREELGYASLEPVDEGAGNETAIRWDSDGGMYLLVNISETNADWLSRKALLLYSPDGMQTWQVYVMPEYLVRFEKFVGHNPDCRNGPPVILLSHYLSPTTISLAIPERQPDGTLLIPPPAPLAADGIALIPHSGESNQALTHDGKVYLVYGRNTVLPGYSNEDGVPAFARTYDLVTQQLSEPVLIGFGGVNAEDGHNWPGLAADSQGILHVIINGHHNPFVYTRSVRPWDISEWTTSEEVAAGTSYAGLVCDDQNALYAVTRHAEPGYYFRLSLHRKPAGQPWEAPQYLVLPYKPYYHVYYHKLTLDPRRQRLFLSYWTQTSNLCLFLDEYYAAVYMWPDRQKPFLERNPELPQGSYDQWPAVYQFYSAPPSELTVAVSDDRGATWRLATTEDFDAGSAGEGTIREDFESYGVGDILGAGHGWTETGAQVIMGDHGSKAIRDEAAAAYFNGTRYAGFTPLGAGYTGPAHMAMTVVPKQPGGEVVYHGYQVKAGATGYEGPQIGFTADANPAADYSGRGRFFVRTCNPGGAWYFSDEIQCVDHIHDLLLNMDIVNHQYDVYGTLYYRDVTPGFETGWIKTSIDNISLNSNVSAGPYNASHLQINGGFDGQIDNLAWGSGHVPVVSPPAPGSLVLVH